MMGTMIANITPAEIRDLRASLGLTQREFALRYDVPLESLRNWEQERRRPDTVANLLLQLVRVDPVGIAALLGRLRLEQAWAPKP